MLSCKPLVSLFHLNGWVTQHLIPPLKKKKTLIHRDTVICVITFKGKHNQCESKFIPGLLSESDVTYSQVWWPILRICALHLPIQSAHTHSTHKHTGALGSHLCCGARGAVGGSVPCSRAPRRGIEGGESAVNSVPPHLQFLPTQDSNSQPFDYESDSLTIRPWLKQWSHINSRY